MRGKTRYPILRGLLVLVALILLILKFLPRPPLHGFTIRMVGTECDAQHADDASRAIVLQVLPDGRTAIRDIPLGKSVQIGPWLKEIYAARVTRTLFIDIDDEISVQAAVDELDEARAFVPELIFVVITPKSRQACYALWRPEWVAGRQGAP